VLNNKVVRFRTLRLKLKYCGLIGDSVISPIPVAFMNLFFPWNINLCNTLLGILEAAHPPLDKVKSDSSIFIESKQFLFQKCHPYDSLHLPRRYRHPGIAGNWPAGPGYCRGAPRIRMQGHRREQAPAPCPSRYPFHLSQ
jgi:hypothetical protein